MEETNKYLRDAIVEAKNRLAVVQVQRTLMDNYEVSMVTAKSYSP